MRVRSVLFASVCSVLLAAGAAVSSSEAAEKSQSAITADKAYASLVSGKLVQAIAQYSEAIESRQLEPELLANSLLNRALAYQNRGQHSDAVDDYSTAMRLGAMGQRLQAVALYNRGISYQKLEKPAQAIEDFTNALFLDAEFAQAYYSRGNVLRESGQYLFALSDYEKALKYHHPEPHLPLYGTALTYEDLRRPLNAQKSLVQALALKPDFAAARLKLSNLMRGEDIPAKLPVTKALNNNSASLAAGREGIVTASLDVASADVIMRKKDLPVPVSPPSALMQKVSLGGTKRVKKIQSRVAAEVEIEPIAAPPVIEPANAPPPIAKPADEIVTASVAATTPKLIGWTVQLSSQKNENAAWNAWKKMQARHSKLLSNSEAMVVQADLGDRGVFYRLRVHQLETKKSAARLCSRLKKRGTSCFVSRANS